MLDDHVLVKININTEYHYTNTEYSIKFTAQ